MSKIGNVLTMIEYLSTGRKYSIAELSEKLEITPRMIRVYKDEIEVTKRAKSNLWYIFIPKNCEKTLAEMSDEERKNRNDGHTSATELFAEWYQNIYLKQNVKKLSLL